MVENVIPLKLTAPVALRIIREIAADTSKVVFIPHAKKRMRERRITPDQVYKCLRNGNMDEGPAMMANGNWRCTLQRLVAGDDVAVVAEFNSREKLLVITVI